MLHISGSSSGLTPPFFKLSEVVDTIFPSLVGSNGANYAEVQAGLAQGIVSHGRGGKSRRMDTKTCSHGL